MLIVLPVTGADYKLAEMTAQLISRFGGVRPHGIMLAFAQSCPATSRKKIEKTLGGASDSLFSYDLQTRDERGWPRSANSVFGELSRAITENGGYGHSHWYFFEADNTPVRPDWAVLIDREYRLAKLPYMGVKHVTFRGAGTHRREAGHHMVGTGIYPSDFFYSCRLAKHVPQIADPFDVAMQWEIVPKMHHTDQILHNWSSHKYVKAKDGIIEGKAFRKGGLPNPIPPDHEFSVVHGCKDSSLPKLVAAAFDL